MTQLRMITMGASGRELNVAYLFGRGDAHVWAGEVGCAVGEVAEGVELGQVLALVLVPRAAHLPPPADVRDGEDHASVQQRRLLVVEHRVDARAVAAVPRNNR